MCTSKSQDTYAYIVSVTTPVDSAQTETYIMFWLRYLLGSEDCAMQFERTETQLFQIFVYILFASTDNIVFC